MEKYGPDRPQMIVSYGTCAFNAGYLKQEYRNTHILLLFYSNKCYMKASVCYFKCKLPVRLPSAPEGGVL